MLCAVREGEVAGVLSGGGIRSLLHEGFVRFLRERCPVVALDSRPYASPRHDEGAHRS